jgi:thiol-disulfide isomerase/thioredoxin
MFRRLHLIGIALLLAGCNNSNSLDRGRSAASPDKGVVPAEGAADSDKGMGEGGGSAGKQLSPKDEVAHLLASNNPFPFDFDLEDVAGNKLSKADLAGKVLIVDLWGTWCPPCRKEIPHFVALSGKYKDQGLAVVGLNSERTPDKNKAAALVRDFCRAEGVDYPCAVVTQEVLDQVPEMRGFPTTLFIDRTGQVRLMVVGYHEISFLQAAVEALLEEKPAAQTEG